MYDTGLRCASVTAIRLSSSRPAPASDPAIRARLDDYRRGLADKVEQAAAALEQS